MADQFLPEYLKMLEEQAKVMASLNKEYKNHLAFQLKSKPHWVDQDNAIKDFTKNMKLMGGGDTLSKFAKGLREGFDSLNEFKQDLDTLDEMIAKAGDTQNKKTLQDQRDAIATKAAMITLQAGALDAGKALTKSLVNGVVGTAGQFVKGLQGNASASELGATVLNGAVDLATGSVGMVGDSMAKAGQVMGQFGGKAKIAGAALDILGSAVSAGAAAVGKLAKFGIEVLSKEVEKTYKAFNAMASSGALFADGMSDMRATANLAGMSLDTFSKVIKENSETIGQSGLGLTAGTKMIANVSSNFARQIGGSGKSVREELMTLGFSIEDQAGLIAETAANMRRGAGGKNDEKAIAEQTQKYAENLRIISNITGEDAKKKVEAAKQQNQILAFQAELAKMGPDQRAQINAATANMKEIELKNFQDRVVLGEVINKEGALYEASVTGAREKSEAALALFKNNELTANSVAKLNAQYGDQIKDSILGNKEMQVATYAAGGYLTGFGKSLLDQVDQANVYTKEAVNAAKENVDKSKASNDALTTGIMGAAVAAEQLKVSLERVLTPAIAQYARVTESILTTLSNTLNDLGFIGKGEVSFWDKLKSAGAGALAGGAGGAVTGAAYGGITGAMAGGVGAAPGALAGAVSGGVIGAVGGAIAGWFDAKSGKAEGGIAEGPESGYLEKLHGMEAVVPLEGGRSIPVDLSGITEALSTAMSVGKSALSASPLGMAAGAVGEMGKSLFGPNQTDLMQEQIGLLREIHETLTSSNGLQQQYVYNTYN
jgi:hypothetical protein